MSNATQLSLVLGQLTSLATQFTAYDSAAPADQPAAEATVFATGKKVAKNCAMLRDALSAARKTNARTAIAAILDLSAVPPTLRRSRVLQSTLRRWIRWEVILTISVLRAIKVSLPFDSYLRGMQSFNP
jgi:hypothetical protein